MFPANLLGADSMLLALAVCYAEGMEWDDAMTLIQQLFSDRCGQPVWAAVREFESCRFFYEQELTNSQPTSLGRIFQGFGLNLDLGKVILLPYIKDSIVGFITFFRS